MDALARRYAWWSSVASALVAAGLVAATVVEKGVVLFTAHPALMGIAFVGLMGPGMVVYTGRPETRAESRRWHRSVQAASFSLLVLGLCAIVLNKMKLGKSVVPHSVHAWTASGALVLCLFQGTVGLMKFQQAQSTGASQHKWHGKVGNITYAFGVVAIALGIDETFKDSYVRYGLIGATSACALLVVAVSRGLLPLRGRICAFPAAGRPALLGRHPACGLAGGGCMDAHRYCPLPPLGAPWLPNADNVVRMSSLVDPEDDP